MTFQTQIKTRADGSIDTAHYMARGRHMRSQQAQSMAARGGRGLARTLPAVAVCVLAAILVAPALF